MNAKVEVDKNSGFCPGVIRAVEIAESKLAGNDGRKTFSLGALVHNEAVLGRLEARGLVAVDIEDLDEMQAVTDSDLIIRAHGEPPSTYSKARALGFNVIDCTCPVVLKLQTRIRDAFRAMKEAGAGQILIFGKVGHAEVLGLVGQTDGEAIVIESMLMLESMLGDGTVSSDLPTEIFSQTTKSPQEYAKVCER
ncbi:MAG: 4-hydroxy-3-methylbut-2-enyl diphosphate reductase, partial [Candidatus Cryptobacteroides sp.]